MILSLILILPLQSVYAFEDLHEEDYMALFSMYFPVDDEVVITPFYSDSIEEDMRARVDEFSSRWNDFESGLDFSDCITWHDTIEVEKRMGLERGMVALISLPGIDSIALAYVARAPAPYEWEGCWDVIGMEIDYAMEFMLDNPETPLRPFLILFLMHRLRAQEECLTMLDGEPADSVIALYSNFYHEAIQSPDTLVRYFARDLDMAEYVYLGF